MQGRRGASENARVVVQCTSCQSKFRIADDKVTERGVRVRCTSCKNVFQVKKAGSTSTDPAPGPGSTMELSALDAAALARPSPRNAALGAGRAAATAARPAAAPPAPRPQAPPRPAGKTAPEPAAAPNGRRLEADDLFGMAELTGESPLGELAPGVRPPPPPATRPPGPNVMRPPAPPASRAPAAEPSRPAAARPAPPPLRPPAAPARPPAAAPRPGPSAGPARPAAAGPKPAAKPIPSFDDIDIEVDDTPSPPPRAPAPMKPATTSRPLPPLVVPGAAAASAAVPLPAPPPRGPEPIAVAPPPPPPPPSDLFDEPASPPPPPGDAAPVKLGAFKTTLKDPFEGMNLGEGGGASAVDLAGAAKKPPAPAPEKPAAPAPEEPQVPYSASREFVSSALTGLVGAALALAVILAAALSEDAPYGWLGLGAGGDIVATRLVSGLYDTVAGKPVFFVRGRVENRSKKARGPVRVIAELVADSGPGARTETIAGAEPTPEDVYGLRTAAEAEKLARSLEGTNVVRRVDPGGSLPFFAVIAEPPADLEGHKLRVRLESEDAWVPPQPKAVNKVR